MNAPSQYSEPCDMYCQCCAGTTTSRVWLHSRYSSILAHLPGAWLEALTCTNAEYGRDKFLGTLPAESTLHLVSPKITVCWLCNKVVLQCVRCMLFAFSMFCVFAMCFALCVLRSVFCNAFGACCLQCVFAIGGIVQIPCILCV